MLKVPSNKSLDTVAVPAEREQILEALLASPLARELERSMTESFSAVRERAREALQSEVSLTKAEELASLARELVDRREALKRQYETAVLDADAAADRANQERENVLIKRHGLSRVASAGEAWLRENGLQTVADLKRRFGLK